MRSERKTHFFLENLLVIFLVYDFIVKLIVAYSSYAVLFKYIIVFKVVYLIFLIVYYKLKITNYTLVWTVVALSIAYALVQAFSYDVLYADDINFNGYYFLSSILPIAFLCFCFNIDDRIIQRQVNVFLWFILVSALLIFIGYLFDIKVFKAYYRAERFGFIGLLLYHHEAGYILFLALNLFYIKVKRTKSWLTTVFLLIVLFSSLLYGTKKAVFFTIIFIIYYIIDNARSIKLLTRGLAIFGLFALVFHKTIQQVYIKYHALFYKIYHEDGFWSSFLSYRDLLLKENLLPYVSREDSFFNILFGWPFFREHRSELDFFDLFLFFGIVGILSYACVFIVVLRKQKIEAYYIVFSMLLGSIFSGNLFASANVMLLLFITLKYLNIKSLPKE